MLDLSEKDQRGLCHCVDQDGEIDSLWLVSWLSLEARRALCVGLLRQLLVGFDDLSLGRLRLRLPLRVLFGLVKVVAQSPVGCE